MRLNWRSRSLTQARLAAYSIVVAASAALFALNLIAPLWIIPAVVFAGLFCLEGCPHCFKPYVLQRDASPFVPHVCDGCGRIID